VAETEPTSDLRDAVSAYERAVDRVDEHGEHDLEQLADAHDRARRTVESYGERAVGTGDFEAYVRLQEEVGALVESLPESSRAAITSRPSTTHSTGGPSESGTWRPSEITSNGRTNWRRASTTGRMLPVTWSRPGIEPASTSSTWTIGFPISNDSRTLVTPTSRHRSKSSETPSSATTTRSQRRSSGHGERSRRSR